MTSFPSFPPIGELELDAPLWRYPPRPARASPGSASGLRPAGPAASPSSLSSGSARPSPTRSRTSGTACGPAGTAISPSSSTIPPPSPSPTTARLAGPRLQPRPRLAHRVDEPPWPPHHAGGVMSQAEWAVPAERAAAPGPDSGWCSSGGARPVDSEEPGSGGSCGRPPGQQRQAEKAGPGYDLAFPDLGGVPAVLVHGAASYGAAWCADASATTGAAMAYTDRASGAVLLLAVNKRVYAVSYGDGHRLIRDELKDQRFGLRFAVRQLDADRIHWLVPPDAGRSAPAGLDPGARRAADLVLLARRVCQRGRPYRRRAQAGGPDLLP